MKSTTKIFRAVAACFSGIALCNLFVYIEGYLAALAIPREYFLWFGHQHALAALFVLDIFTFVLPFFALSIAWGILTNLVLRTRSISTSLWSGLGCILPLIYFSFFEGPNASIFIASLKEPYMLLLFLLHLMAGPCGILVGGYLLSRFSQGKREALA